MNRTTRRTPADTTAPAPSQEQDTRLQLLNSFMTCPHRDTNKVKEIHEVLRANDPAFYPKLASWYFNKGDIRDHKEVFTAMLLNDPFIENRETGLALFRQSPLFMKDKIKGFLKGKMVKQRVKTGETIKKGRKTIDKHKIELIHVGMNQNIPSALKTEITQYLKWLEEDNDRFDSRVMSNARALKGLYASIHRRPPERHNEVLFERKYPEDSKLGIYKKIIEAKTPEDAAKLIVENKVPYRIAVGLIKQMTPSVMVALINAMSSQELITNMASLEARGARENPDIAALIDKKLTKAAKSSKVTALKSKAAKAQVKDEALAKKLDEVADKLVKKRGIIKIPTAIFVDKSTSMQNAIEVGTRLAAMISGVTESDLYVLAFDNMAMEVRAKGKALSDWETAFARIRPHGWTSVGCALEKMLRDKIRVEQIIIITDEGENEKPLFADVFKRYEQEMGITPNVVILYIPSSESRNLSASLRRSQIAFDTYQPDGNDYYGIPGLLPLLTKNSKLDLLYEIMDTPLPVRRPFAEYAEV